MRLIDADAINFRCSYNGTCMANGEQCRRCANYVCDFEDIQEQPTAYDVEKVVEQIHKIFLKELDIVEKDIPEGAEYTEEAYRLFYLNKCVSDAIRNGGKE